MKRKFFAAFLSLCMVMSLVPMTALAVFLLNKKEGS